jgi:hypothetical protein
MLHIVHFPCIRPLFIKIQLNTLTRLHTPCCFISQYLDMFCLIPSHHQGDKHKEIYIFSYIREHNMFVFVHRMQHQIQFLFIVLC